MKKKFLDFLKKQKIATIFVSVGMIFIYVFCGLIMLSSRDFKMFAMYGLVTAILLPAFVLIILYYRFFCRASYSLSVQDGNVIFYKRDEEKAFRISDCTEIKFYPQWVKFKFSNETIYLLTYLTLKDSIFGLPSIDVKTAKQIFTNAIIKY